jgi:hypothetical protein
MADFPTWLAALRRSHERMTALVGGLTDEQAALRSYADEWSLAQVASHLGSQAEVFELFLTAGLAGTRPRTPTRWCRSGTGGTSCPPQPARRQRRRRTSTSSPGSNTSSRTSRTRSRSACSAATSTSPG